MTGSFFAFSELNDAVAATTKKLEKRALIAAYLRSLSVEDAARASLYLSGTPFAETDRRSLNAGGSLLSKALAACSGATPSAMSAAYRRHGDMGAAAQDLLEANRRTGPNSETDGLTLAIVEDSLARIADARGPAPKLRLVTSLLEAARPVEVKYLLKLMLGDMRTGVKQSLVEEAIATAFEVEIVEVRRASMLVGDLPQAVRLAAANHLDEARMKLFHPIGFMLASPVDSVEEAVERFTEEVLLEEMALEAAVGEESSPRMIDSGMANEPAASGRIYGVLEDKYDGIRAQLHCGDASQRGRVELFSRSREDLSESFPEIVEAFVDFPEKAILDGEILAWNPDTNRALPFTALQQRIGRKKVTRAMREQTPVTFMAFDTVFLNDALLLEEPLFDRRRRLKDFVSRYASNTATAEVRGQVEMFADNSRPAFPRLMLAPAVRLESAEQLNTAYAEARARGNEGVMLKSLNSTYQPGRRGLAWLKLKRELATLDVVVTGAEFGNGRRAAVLSDYTFAVRDGDELRNVGKAYSGLTDVEIAELTEYFKQHTLEDNGHFRTVEPRKVLEVAFNNIMRSDRHDSGFALRFPRIVRIRDDKPVEEIDTLDRVEEIYESQPDKG